MNGIDRADRLGDLRERIVEAARRWYHSDGNAEAELAALIQQLEALPQQQGAPTR